MVDHPLLDAWLAAREKGLRPLQIPGHKYRYAGDDAVLGSDRLGPLIRDDVSLQGGADDNHYSLGVLERSERLWATSVHADHARFQLQGTARKRLQMLIDGS